MSDLLRSERVVKSISLRLDEGRDGGRGLQAAAALAIHLGSTLNATPPPGPGSSSPNENTPFGHSHPNRLKEAPNKNNSSPSYE